MKTKNDTKRNTEDIAFLEMAGFEDRVTYRNTMFEAFSKATDGNTRHFIVVTPVAWVGFINDLLEYGASNGWIYRPDLTTFAYRWLTMTFQKVEEGGN